MKMYTGRHIDASEAHDFEGMVLHSSITCLQGHCYLMTWNNVGLIKNASYLLDNKCLNIPIFLVGSMLLIFLDFCVVFFVLLSFVYTMLSVSRDCPFDFLCLFTTSLFLTWQDYNSDLDAFMTLREYNWRHKWCKTTWQFTK